MKNKNDPVRAARLAALLLFVLLPAALQASQAVPTQQTLDRVFAFTGNSVINMAFGNARRPPDFTNLGLTGNDYTACALTAVSGLFCLDGQVLRRWPNPMNPASSETVLDCMDAALGLDRRGDGCTGMTVDQSGSIWLAGKKKNGHSVIKVVNKGTACPAANWVTLQGGALCAKELYSGRPVLVDLTAIDGSAAETFRACPSCAPQGGVLGLEERKNAVFFPDPAAATPVVVVGSRDWGLGGRELLQDVTLLQISSGSTTVNHIVATTSAGRVLARSTAIGGGALQVFNIAAERIAGSAICSTAEAHYGLRRSATSTTLYLSDSNYCQVVALMPDAPAFTRLVNVQSEGADLVLRTADGPEIYPLSGLTVAPGISFLLADCRISCGLVNGEDGASAATLTSVRLTSYDNSGATIFQIRGIPDCRYATLPECATTPGVIVNPDGGCAGPCPAAAQSLNVTPLLPPDVVNAFAASGLTASGTLPQLLVSPQYRGRADRDYVFEAFFVMPNPAVRYIDTFEGEFDIPLLENSVGSLGCTVYPGKRLIEWDVITIVSELFRSTGGKYIDSIANTGCGSTRLGTGRLSLVPYDLEVSPDTYAPTLASPTPVYTAGNDAVFARLLQRLYAELGYVQREYACKTADPAPGTGLLSAIAPIGADCGSLDSIWANGLVKLDKCIEAAFQPKQSAGDENCQSFVSQLTNYRARLPATTPGQDVANRVGELKARVAVILHVYATRFLPSVPATGFCRESGAAGCANPWY